MEFFKNPKLKMPIRLSAIVISIIEIIILRMVYLNYGTVISYGYFITLILMQPYWYFNITNPHSKIHNSPRFKFSATSIILISLILIISFPAALPKYTYNQGKALLYNSGYFTAEKTCLVYDNTVDTLPVTSFSKGFPKLLFINDRFYYYKEVDINDTERYFMVNPLTGKIIELKDDFYSY